MALLIVIFHSYVLFLKITIDYFLFGLVECLLLFLFGLILCVNIFQKRPTLFRLFIFVVTMFLLVFTF
jgi:hypothetical protein